MFTGRFNQPPVEVLFDRVCRENGITHRLTQPRSPTTTGKIERFHRTLRAEFRTDRAFASMAVAQAELDAWQPNPANIETLDHLFTTKHGDLDVVPRICGTYEELLPQAKKVQAFGAEVYVAHFDEVLSRIESVEREKDRDRIDRMRAVRDRDAGGSGT